MSDICSLGSDKIGVILMTNVDAPRIDENEELRAEAISPTFVFFRGFT